MKKYEHILVENTPQMVNVAKRAELSSDTFSGRPDRTLEVSILNNGEVSFGELANEAFSCETSKSKAIEALNEIIDFIKNS